MKAWGRVLHDEDLAQAIIDRVLERGRLLRLDGPSVRTLHVNLDDAMKEESDQQADLVRISGKNRSEFPEPTPGAAEWVKRLRDQGWRQAIASSAPHANVEVMLGALRLDEAFDAIVSAEDVTAGKPDPQVFLAAARKLSTAPVRCIVVEDAAAGVEAAGRAGMRCIGVAATPLEADVSVRSLADLPTDAFSALLSRSTTA